MIALDTNILVYAHREELPHFERARELLERLATGSDPWAIPWPCAYEFLRVVTHPRVFTPPTPLDDALETLEILLASPSVVLLGNGPAHARHMASAVSDGRATGNMVHDAHIAALMVEHGVRELWTTDRDFTRFPGFPTRNPLLPEDIARESRAKSRARSSVRRPARRSPLRASRGQ